MQNKGLIGFYFVLVHVHAYQSMASHVCINSLNLSLNFKPRFENLNPRFENFKPRFERKGILEPLKRHSRLQQTTNFATYSQTILMKYHALLLFLKKTAKFEIVVCCKLYVGVYG